MQHLFYVIYFGKRSRRSVDLRKADASETSDWTESVGLFLHAFPCFVVKCWLLVSPMLRAGLAAQINTVNDDRSCRSM